LTKLPHIYTVLTLWEIWRNDNRSTSSS